MREESREEKRREEKRSEEKRREEKRREEKRREEKRREEKRREEKRREERGEEFVGSIRTRFWVIITCGHALRSSPSVTNLCIRLEGRKRKGEKRKKRQNLCERKLSKGLGRDSLRFELLSSPSQNYKTEPSFVGNSLSLHLSLFSRSGLLVAPVATSFPGTSLGTRLQPGDERVWERGCSCCVLLEGGQGVGTFSGCAVPFNPFTPKSDQCQIFSAASPVILHRTV